MDGSVWTMAVVGKWSVLEFWHVRGTGGVYILAVSGNCQSLDVAVFGSWQCSDSGSVWMLAVWRMEVYLGNCAGSLSEGGKGALHVLAHLLAPLRPLLPHSAGHQRHHLLWP